ERVLHHVVFDAALAKPPAELLELGHFERAVVGHHERGHVVEGLLELVDLLQFRGLRHAYLLPETKTTFGPTGRRSQRLTPLAASPPRAERFARSSSRSREHLLLRLFSCASR